MSVELHRTGNNVAGLIQNNPLTSGGTNLIVDNTTDGKLNAIGSFPFFLTLWTINTLPNTDPNMEIVNVTARVSPNNYTITRAQQGTIAIQHNLNDNVGLLWTAGNAQEVVTTDAVTLGSVFVYDIQGVPHALPVGANGKFLAANSSATYGIDWETPTAFFQGIFSNGLTTKNVNDASVAQTIAHGLGVAPKKVKLTANGSVVVSSTTGFSVSIGVYNTTGPGSNRIAQVFNAAGSPVETVSTSSADSAGLFGTGVSDPSIAGQIGVVTVDATNITITWTKHGTPNSNVYSIMWEAEA